MKKIALLILALILSVSAYSQNKETIDSLKAVVADLEKTVSYEKVNNNLVHLELNLEYRRYANLNSSSPVERFSDDREWYEAQCELFESIKRLAAISSIRYGFDDNEISVITHAINSIDILIEMWDKTYEIIDSAGEKGTSTQAPHLQGYSSETESTWDGEKEFEVFQVLDKNHALASGLSYAGYSTKIYGGTVVLLQSENSFYDKQVVKAKQFSKIGTYQYETKGGNTKVVPVLIKAK